MILKSTPYLAGLLMATSLAVALPAAAQARPMGGAESMHQMRGGPANEGRAMHWLRRLDLSEEQRDQIFKIYHAQAPALRERMGEVRTAREELRKATLAPNFDSGQVRQLADAQAKAMAEVTVMRAETMHRVAALLTPEQRTKLEEARSHGAHRR